MVLNERFEKKFFEKNVIFLDFESSHKLPFGISIVKTSTWEVNTGDFAELYDVIGFELDIWALICSSLDTLESLRRY